MARSQDAPVIEIRRLTNTGEFAEAVRLQKSIWGFSELDCLPVRLFVVATKIGGQAFGAFDGGKMIGFCVALPGIKPGGGNFLHSNMLGVEAPYRDFGIGRRLKLAQREDALSRGVGVMEWTFDPLEIKNAFFNMERLGAVVKRYVLNQYGITTSGLHGGLPTDRCIAEWFLGSARVKGTLERAAPPRPPVEARIEIPDGILALKKTDPGAARDVQRRVSDQFLELLRQGLMVTGVERTQGDDGGTYLFGHWEPD